MGRIPGRRNTGPPGCGPPAPPARRVAVVGPSGAGKSTLAAVLLRFLPLAGGSVLLNDVSIDRLAGDDLRTVVGLVGQDAYLFDATIAENLRIGRRQSTDDELRGVLDRVGLAGWLADLPSGLGTEVGRHGSRLSGGQRQRVAVARALLADFPVLVLDEPAEHLEPAAADALTSDILGGDRRSVPGPHHPPAGRARVGRRDPGDGRGSGGRAGHPRRADRPGRPLLPPVVGGDADRALRLRRVADRHQIAIHHPAQPTVRAPRGGPNDRRDAQ